MHWDETAPITEWKVAATYQTDQECRDALAKGAADYWGYKIPGRCVATDDPRLKGK